MYDIFDAIRGFFGMITSALNAWADGDSIWPTVFLWGGGSALVILAGWIFVRFF
jgi:hypothetical protein